jgi:hypothetical protein
MKYGLEYGKGAKLLNLFLKMLPVWNKFPEGPLKKRLINFLHVPLDKYTIQGLKKVIPQLGIPANATMGFVKDCKTYEEFQGLIRKVSKKASVSPIYYEILAQNNKISV